MELRRVLFDYRLTQARVIRVARAEGYGLSHTSMSLILTGQKDATPREREAIRFGLTVCGVPADVIDSCPAIVPRVDRRLIASRDGVANGEG